MIQFQFDMVDALPVSAGRQVPSQIRVLGQELPEMEGQLAFVADDCAFTGINRLHYWVKMQYFSENASVFLLKTIIFTGR